METDLAALLLLLALAALEVDLDGLGTTALGVLDGGSALGAGLGLLAGGSVTHLVVELEISIVIDGDIDLLDGETILLLVVAGDLGGLLLGDGVLHALAVEGTLGHVVALAEAVGAGPATAELEVSVVEVLLAILEVRPVETLALLVGTLVVVVLGSVVSGSLTVPGGGDLLGSQPRDEEGNGTLHFASN